MRTLLVGFAMAAGMLAQTEAAKFVEAKPEEAKVAGAKPADTKAAETPVAATEDWLTGSVDVGYRWRTAVAGSFESYRSIVNLGAGPKLLGTDFTLVDPAHRLFDRIDVRASGWGGEPYSTFYLDARKAKSYRFNADYRDIAYFSASPSYADPLLSRGILLNEQARDQRNRLSNFTLDLLPGNWLIPYVAYDRTSGTGRGVSTFVESGNEYAVPTAVRDSFGLYRGGVRMELRRFHATLEQGGTTFKDDQSLYQAGLNLGNVNRLFLGQTLDITKLAANYGIRGNSIFSRALLTATPTSWLDLYGQFLYSQPETNVHYNEAAAGNLYLPSQALFYTSQQYLLSAAAKMPHTTASLGFEIRPTARIRITETWMTDRLHNASAANSTLAVGSGVGTPQSIATALGYSLANNYSQQETNLFFDVTRKLTLRAGYRYVWGDGYDATVIPAGSTNLANSSKGRLQRNVALGGVIFRPSQKLSLTGDVEVASSGADYYRTSLRDYRKVKARARYQLFASLNLSASFAYLNNQTPLAGTVYDYQAHQESLSLLWSPKGAKYWDMEGTYSHSDLRSNLGYLAPQDFSAQTSLYRDHSHTATAVFNLKLPHTARFAPTLALGGSLFLSKGSRETSYYQPLTKFALPLGRHLVWFAEWRYYGYAEPLYFYENFRAHLVTAGMRFTR